MLCGSRDLRSHHRLLFPVRFPGVLEGQKARVNVDYVLGFALYYLLLENREVHLLLRGFLVRARLRLRGLLLGEAGNHTRPHQGLGLLEHRRPRVVVGYPVDVVW